MEERLPAKRIRALEGSQLQSFAYGGKLRTLEIEFRVTTPSAYSELMLHKTTYMRGFHIQATDGGIGHVDDFLVDECWNVRYLVVDTSNWLGGKSVIIPSTAIQEVNSPDKKILLKLTRAEVKACPDVETADITLIETLGPTIM
jgi:hypothetical protein